MENRRKSERGSIIKFEIAQSSTYPNCLIKTEEGGIFHVVCEDERKRNEWISLICGKKSTQGVCVLDGIDTKSHLQEYRKKVDLIDREKIVSTLTVKEYLVFYTMVTGIYSDRTLQEIEDFLRKNGMEGVQEKNVNELNEIEKIEIRCMAAYLKKTSCLVGKNLLDGLNLEQKERFYFFLKEYFVKNHCICLLFDSKLHHDKEKAIKIP